jgi:hypothetical protein
MQISEKVSERKFEPERDKKEDGKPGVDPTKLFCCEFTHELG